MTRPEAFTALTAADPAPLETAARANQTLTYAGATGLATGRGHQGRTPYTVTCRKGSYTVTTTKGRTA